MGQQETPHHWNRARQRGLRSTHALGSWQRERQPWRGSWIENQGQEERGEGYEGEKAMKGKGMKWRATEHSWTRTRVISIVGWVQKLEGVGREGTVGPVS